MGRDPTIVSRLRAASARLIPAEPLERRVLFSSVVGRFLFYNNSAFDGRDPALNTQDLGAVATEFLMLGIDPYPRKPWAEFAAPKVDSDGAHPFAALAALKKDPGASRS